MNDETVFEDEVRRVARALWPSAQYQGATILRGRERDGMFVTPESIHLVEATVSRKKQKAVDDCRKLSKTVRELRRADPTRSVQGWFVTKEEPTAEQRIGANRFSPDIIAVSFDQFRSKLVDAAQYLELRRNAAFGSCRDLDGQGPRPSDESLVDIEILKQGTTQKLSIRKISKQLHQGQRFLLVGEYGSGKSTSLYRMHRELSSRFYKKRYEQFPLFISLRDHQGQTSPAEALIRHADSIGFPIAGQLVRAWRAGYVTLILDGFDEIAPAGWNAFGRRLADARRSATELVRAFVRDTPNESGIILSGRPNYFDSDAEMTTALGISDHFTRLELEELSDSELHAFLEIRGLETSIPDWIPTKPLLVAYLASRHVLGDAARLGDVSPAEGWDKLLTLICEREEEVETGIDSLAIRSIVERLATKARGSQDGVGPLAPETILKTFEEICGYLPDERGAMLLQRLPGLTPASSGDSSRIFVNDELASTARAADVYPAITEPFGGSRDKIDAAALTHGLEASRESLDEFALSVLDYWCDRDEVAESKLSVAVELAAQSGNKVIAADLASLLMYRGATYTRSNIRLDNSVFAQLTIAGTESDRSNITISNSFIHELVIDQDVDGRNLPRFTECIIGTLVGRTGLSDFACGVFDDLCIAESATQSVSTTDSIIELTLPDSVAIALIVLRKLFRQRGAGRKRSALSRGLPLELRPQVDDVLSVLSREEFARTLPGYSNEIWVPVRAKTSRVLDILSAPTSSSDDLLVALRCQRPSS